MSESAQTMIQEKALISSPAFDTVVEASVWGDNPSNEPFVPGNWGKDALDLLGDNGKKKALAIIQHLDPEVDRNQPVTVTTAYNVWGPIGASDGSNKVFVVLVADITCSRKPAEPAAETT